MQIFYDEETSQDLKNSGFSTDSNYEHSVCVSSLSVKNKAQQKALGKDIGEYYIIHSPHLHTKKPAQNYTQKLLTQILKKFVVSKAKKILVVGLGNEQIQADSFGTMCVDYIRLKKNIFAIKPNVYANTNVMSFDIVKGVCTQIKPDLVLIVDSLGTQNISRLACSFQLCNVGILPGGALHGLNKPISTHTLGVPCVVIGVPFMVFCKGINPDLDAFYQNMLLTPKDIQTMATRCALMVCKSIAQLTRKV